MHRVIILAVALLTVGLVPAASGYHISVGTYDSALVTPGESPEAPSVSDGLFERGTTTDGCYEPTGAYEAQPGELTEAAEADPMCGRLVYHAGTGYEQVSPADQDILMDGWTFDVVMASYAGNYGISTCAPFCLPGTEGAYRDGHDVGATLGLTGNGSEAWGNDGGWQQYAGNLMVPHPTLTASQMLGYSGNGWTLPLTDVSFVGFLQDANGETIDDAELSEIVAEQQSQGLASSAAAQVCGFTPDWSVSINAPQSTFCEVLFLYQDESGGTDTDIGDDYQDPCASPAYVCGTITPAWYGQVVCKVAPATSSGSGCGAYGQDQPAWSQTDYDIWHFVVAPSPSACSTAQEPGFAFQTGTAKPYLAHDLDIYQPVTEPAGVNSYGAIDAWRQAVQATVQADVDEATASLIPDLPELPGLPDLPELGASLSKSEKTEPNAPGDTSHSISIERTVGEDPCTQIVESLETPDTVDPWVNHIDTDLWMDIGAGGLGNTCVYQNDDPDQDPDNNPCPGQYYTNGFVGMFTDKNDDGDYDQAGAGSLFEDIYTTGAYPLFFDMRVTPAGEIDTETGCTRGYNDETLTSQMAEAGYGPRTGLLQVVYLSEPTVWRHAGTNDAITYTDGDGIYILLSQALRAQLDDPSVQGLVEAAIAKLPTEAQDAARHYPGSEAGFQSDFGAQCGAATGGYGTAWRFVHACELGCAGDTIVTAYVLDNQAIGGVIGGAGDIPAFAPQGHEGGYAFPTGLNQWFDVDPIDGDPDRNLDEDGSPPT